jgi:hypothetical protein
MAITQRYVRTEDASKHNHYKGEPKPGSVCAVGEIWNYESMAVAVIVIPAKLTKDIVRPPHSVEYSAD